MNDIAKQIADGTKALVEESGKVYKEPDFEDDDQPNNPTPEEIQKFSDQIVSQIGEGLEMKKQEQKQYRKMFGDPKGNTSGSYSISN